MYFGARIEQIVEHHQHPLDVVRPPHQQQLLVRLYRVGLRRLRAHVNLHAGLLVCRVQSSMHKMQ